MGAYSRLAPDGGQLLHGDDGGGTADAGGANRDLLPQQGAGIGGILPVGLDLDGVVEIGRDLLAPARVSRQDTVAAHVPLFTLYMELQLMFLHMPTSKDLVISL